MCPPRFSKAPEDENRSSSELSGAWNTYLSVPPPEYTPETLAEVTASIAAMIWEERIATGERVGVGLGDSVAADGVAEAVSAAAGEGALADWPHAAMKAVSPSGDKAGARRSG